MYVKSSAMSVQRLNSMNVKKTTRYAVLVWENNTLSALECKQTRFSFWQNADSSHMVNYPVLDVSRICVHRKCTFCTPIPMWTHFVSVLIPIQSKI